VAGSGVELVRVVRRRGGRLDVWVFVSVLAELSDVGWAVELVGDPPPAMRPRRLGPVTRCDASDSPPRAREADRGTWLALAWPLADVHPVRRMPVGARALRPLRRGVTGGYPGGGSRCDRRSAALLGRSSRIGPDLRSCEVSCALARGSGRAPNWPVSVLDGSRGARRCGRSRAGVAEGVDGAWVVGPSVPPSRYVLVGRRLPGCAGPSFYVRMSWAVAVLALPEWRASCARRAPPTVQLRDRRVAIQHCMQSRAPDSEPTTFRTSSAPSSASTGWPSSARSGAIRGRPRPQVAGRCGMDKSPSSTGSSASSCTATFAAAITRDRSGSHSVRTGAPDSGRPTASADTAAR
jgi:hypothetical protein